jgi:hypothetical protein
MWCSSGRSQRPPEATSSNKRLQPAALNAFVCRTLFCSSPSRPAHGRAADPRHWAYGLSQTVVCGMKRRRRPNQRMQNSSQRQPDFEYAGSVQFWTNRVATPFTPEKQTVHFSSSTLHPVFGREHGKEPLSRVLLSSRLVPVYTKSRCPARRPDGGDGETVVRDPKHALAEQAGHNDGHTRGRRGESGRLQSSRSRWSNVASGFCLTSAIRCGVRESIQ